MLSRRLFALGTLCFAAIVIYGSLVPFHYQPLGLSELIEQFTTVCTTPISKVSRSDFLANILLFVPLSFLLMGSFLYGQSSRGWLLLVPIVLVCALFGAFIEALQLMFPPRSSSLSDILAQSIGSVAGGLLWVLAGVHLTNRFNTLTGRLDASHRLFRFLPIYLLLIVILETAPFDFTLSPVELVHKWRGEYKGRISLVPFAAFFDPSHDMVVKSFWTIVLFMPMGLLIGLKKNQSSWLVLAIGLLIGAGVEFLQLLVLSRNFEPTDILIAGTAIWFGWFSIQLHAKQSYNQSSLLLALWIVLAVAINWTPFDFDFSNAWHRLTELSLVPFADYQQKHYLSAFDDLVHKLILFILLGILLTANRAFRLSAVTVTCLGTLLSTLIEIGQLLLPSRYPSISDIVLGSVGSLAGYSIVTAIRSAERSPMQLRIDHQA